MGIDISMRSLFSSTASGVPENHRNSCMNASFGRWCKGDGSGKGHAAQREFAHERSDKDSVDQLIDAEQDHAQNTRKKKGPWIQGHLIW